MSYPFTLFAAFKKSNFCKPSSLSGIAGLKKLSESKIGIFWGAMIRNPMLMQKDQCMRWQQPWQHYREQEWNQRQWAGPERCKKEADSCAEGQMGTYFLWTSNCWAFKIWPYLWLSVSLFHKKPSRNDALSVHRRVHSCLNPVDQRAEMVQKEMMPNTEQNTWGEELDFLWILL